MSTSDLRAVHACYHDERLAEASRAGIDLPAFFPVITNLLVAPDGSYWLERGDVGDELLWSLCSSLDGERTWDHLSPDGAMLHTIRVPAGFRALAATASSVLGVERDDLEVEYVVGYGPTR